MEPMAAVLGFCRPSRNTLALSSAKPRTSDIWSEAQGLELEVTPAV